jgi:hypothetical protein
VLKKGKGLNSGQINSNLLKNDDRNAASTATLILNDNYCII